VQSGAVPSTPARQSRRRGNRSVSFGAQLSGGDPRTLGDVDAVVSVVLAQQQRLGELIDCVVDSRDAIVRMRASDALEKVCRARPALLKPHVAVLLGKMSRVDQPSVRWHVAQMMGHLELSSHQRERAAALLRKNLDESSDWIVLNYTLDSLAVLARQDPQLVPVLRGYLRRYEQSSYKSLSSRARKLLVEFAPRTNRTVVRDSRSAGTRWLRVDPTPMLVSSANTAIAFFARRDLLGVATGPVSDLWDLPQARRIVAKQIPDGRWRYPCGKSSVRSRQNYDQLETFRQVGILVEEFGMTREHAAIERAAEFLFSFQTDEGDFRGIYGNQYATTYVGAITELLVKAGYTRDPRITRAFRWFRSVRQNDGGWAIPVRTVGIPFPEFVDVKRHPHAIRPDPSKPSSHLVTGMVLRAFAADPRRGRSSQARRAGNLLASRLYRKDHYSDRGDTSYWDRVSFPFWFTDIVSALDTLSRLHESAQHPHVRAAIERLANTQRQDGTFELRLMRGKDKDLPDWICLSISRSLKRWDDTAPTATTRLEQRRPTVGQARTSA